MGSYLQRFSHVLPLFCSRFFRVQSSGLIIGIGLSLYLNIAVTFGPQRLIQVRDLARNVFLLWTEISLNWTLRASLAFEKSR